MPGLPSAPAAALALPPAAHAGRVVRRRAALGVVVAAALAAGVTAGLPERGLAPPARARAASSRADAGDAPRTERPARNPRPAPEARPPAERVVAPVHARALFARHSWFVPKPAPPPPAPEPPPPPPPPTAPPFPYAFVGSFTPQGDRPVFFLSRGDRLIEARVGDRLDGIYQLESAAGGHLVFVYLPLDIRQTLAAGTSK